MSRICWDRTSGEFLFEDVICPGSWESEADHIQSELLTWRCDDIGKESNKKRHQAVTMETKHLTTSHWHVTILILLILSKLHILYCASCISCI